MSNIELYQQENELLKTQLQLAKLQAEKASKLEDSLFSPRLHAHYMEIAKSFARSELVPKDYRNKPDNCFIAMAMGYQLGFSVEQSLQNIAVINGRPCVWGDALMALILSNNQLESITENFEYDNNGQLVGALCSIKRKGHELHVISFTINDAKKASLWGKTGPWSSFPSRMLQLRARAFAIRDKFADALMGISVAEEVMDYIDGETIKSSKTNAKQRLDSLLQSKGDAIEANIDEAILDSDTAQAVVDSERTENNPLNATLAQTRNTKTTVVDPTEQNPITDELLDEISGMLSENPLTGDRMEKAMRYFEVGTLEELTIAKAKSFIKMLSVPKKD